MRALFVIGILVLGACSAPAPRPTLDPLPLPLPASESTSTPGSASPPSAELETEPERRVLQLGGYEAVVNSDPVPLELNCPEYESRAAEGVQREIDITANRTGKIIAMGGSARVHIRPGVVFSGDIVICGGGATLIAEGNFTGNVHVRGGGARVVLVDRNPNAPQLPSAPKIYLTGGGVELVACNEQGSHSGLRSCREIF